MIQYIQVCLAKMLINRQKIVIFANLFHLIKNQTGNGKNEASLHN